MVQNCQFQVSTNENEIKISPKLPSFFYSFNPDTLMYIVADLYGSGLVLLENQSEPYIEHLEILVSTIKCLDDTLGLDASICDIKDICDSQYSIVITKADIIVLNLMLSEPEILPFAEYLKMAKNRLFGNTSLPL